MTARLALLVLVVSTALGVGAVSAAPVCSDQLAGVNERCPEWVASYNHTGRGGRGEDVARDLALSPDGATVYVAGQSYGDATGADQATVAFDAATGAQRWVSRYDANAMFDTGSALVVAPDGSAVYVSGRSAGPGTSFDWVTIAYDAGTGAERWVARHETPASDRTWAVTTSPDGAVVYVVGEVAGGDIGAVAYDAATGDELWTAVYDNGGYDWALEIGISPDGATLYAAGTSGSGATGADVVVVAFRTGAEESHPAGSLRWVARVDGGRRGEETFAGLVVRGDRLALAGWTVDAAGANQALTVLLDAADGTEIWRVSTPGALGVDERQAVAFAGDMVIRIARQSLPFPDQTEVYTLAYRIPDGSLAWSRAQGSAPYRLDHAKAVWASNDGGRVYVTGYSQLPRGETGQFKIEPGSIVTIAYDTETGTRRWIAQHDQSGVGADFAAAVLPSHDGQRVYVGGTFITSGVYVWATDLAMAYAYDFGVVAYDA